MQTYPRTHTTQHLQDTQLLIIWIILDSLLSELKRRNAEVTGFDFQVILFLQCGIKIQLKSIENTWTQLSVKPTPWRWFGPAVHEKMIMFFSVTQRCCTQTYLKFSRSHIKNQAQNKLCAFGCLFYGYYVMYFSCLSLFCVIVRKLLLTRIIILSRGRLVIFLF